MIDWTINIGHIFTIATLVVGISSIFFGLRTDIKILRVNFKHLEGRQTSLDEAFKQLGTILTQLALQNNRMDMMQKHIDELRHGKGFVRDKQ